MTAPTETAERTLAPWWGSTVIATMAFVFAVLILLTAKAYQNAPHPGGRRRSFGEAVFTDAEIDLGQQVFLKHGLMDNGTVWGHGAYLGPDFSAQYLHLLALDLADRIARLRFDHPLCMLNFRPRARLRSKP